jgi:hypothetical protein
MELRFIYFLIVSFIVAIACSQKDGPLKMKISPDSSYILPGDELACGESDTKTAGPRIIFNRVEIGWYGSGTLNVAAIQVRVPGRDRLTGDFTCDIGGDTLDAMFGGMSNGVFPSSAAAVTASSSVNANTIYSNLCALKCFGIKASETFKNTPFTLQGEAKIIAYAIEGDTQKPYSVKKPITIRYEP